MPRVLWPNGVIDSAPTWLELLKRVRDAQVRDVSLDTLRVELSKRAWVWNYVTVDPHAKPRDFFEQLERAKMLKILPDDAGDPAV